MQHLLYEANATSEKLHALIKNICSRTASVLKLNFSDSSKKHTVNAFTTLLFATDPSP